MFTVVVSLLVLAAAITAVLALTVGASDKPATEHPPRRRERPGNEPRRRSRQGGRTAGQRPSPGSTVAGRPHAAGRAVPGGVPPEVPAMAAPSPGMTARPVTVELVRRGRRTRAALLLVALLVVVGTAVAVVIAAALALLGISLRDAVT